MAKERRRRAATWFHRRIANPLMRPLSRYVPGGAVLETTGRKSGLPRQTPVGGRRDGDCFWMVSDHGRHSQYVRNIEADPHVRVRVGRRWYSGVAHPMPEDDPRSRLKRLPRANSLLVRLLGTDLLTIRIDLRAEEPAPYGR